MGVIKQLDQSTINKIAAGEVIERPLSVVKELVENSIDALSNNIIVRLREGGKKQISVIDDGLGMDKDDLLMCIKKHATSKISNIEDVFSIKSFGFRGEALATIAEVSKFEMISGLNQTDHSNKIIVENGQIAQVTIDAPRKGTTVNVYNLFYTIPARQKFLKSDGFELKKIVDYVKSIAISNPMISFTLYSDDRQVFEYKGVSEKLIRIKQIYNLDLIESNYQSDNITLKMYFSKPASAIDSSQSIQNFYINSRPIKSDIIQKAVYKAFESKIPKGKKPNVFVFVDIDPDIIDVNVHPQKLEIRVRNESLLYVPVFESISKKLESGLTESAPSIMGNDIVNKLASEYQSVMVDNYVSPEISQNQYIPIQKESFYQRTLSVENNSSNISYSNPSSPSYKIIGQLFDTYFLIETFDQKFMIIDQHVAEERYYYEKFTQEFVQNKSIKSQKLLVPLTLNFTYDQVKIIQEKVELFESLGIYVEIFGTDSILIRQIPLILDKIPSKEELNNIIMDVINDSSSQDERIDHAIATMACKASIKAGQKISENFAKKVIDNLFTTKNPYTCPHGRPVLLELTKLELDKKVGR